MRDHHIAREPRLGRVLPRFRHRACAVDGALNSWSPDDRIFKKQAAPVVVIGYLGFLNTEATRRWFPSFDLEAQIAHSRQSIDDVSRGFESVALVGHSIGALIALDCLDDKCAAAVALMPFVAANDSDPAYRLKRSIATMPGSAAVLACAAFLLRLVPLQLRTKILAALGFETAYMSTAAKSLTLAAMTTPANVHQYVTLGASEFKSPRIIEGPDLSWLPERRPDVGFVYANRPDIWVRPGDPAKMRRLQVETLYVDAEHDFPTRLDSSTNCARAIHHMLHRRK